MVMVTRSDMAAPLVVDRRESAAPIGAPRMPASAQTPRRADDGTADGGRPPVERWATCGFPVDQRADYWGQRKKSCGQPWGRRGKALDHASGPAQCGPCQVAPSDRAPGQEAPGLEVSGSHRPSSNRGSGSAVRPVDASDAGAELRRSASGWGAGFGPAARTWVTPPLGGEGAPCRVGPEESAGESREATRGHLPFSARSAPHRGPTADRAVRYLDRRVSRRPARGAREVGVGRRTVPDCWKSPMDRPLTTSHRRSRRRGAAPGRRRRR